MESKINSLHAAVIGGVNMDIWGRPERALVMGDSNPGTVALRPGGVGRNIAHDLHCLGVSVSLVAAVGGDVYGAAIMDSCRALGLDMSMALLFPERSSSTYLYVTDEQGNMQIAVNDMGICSCLSPERIEPLLPELDKAGALVLDANLPPETIEFICRRSRVPIYADPVSTVKAGRLLPVIGSLAAIKPNAMEAEALTGESEPERAAKALLELGAERVFISLGSEGMIAADRRELLRLPCVKAEVVNTTGAGDAATAAIVWGGLSGLSLEQTARAALRAGALTCESESANSERLCELIR